MGILINTGFDVGSSSPIDSRTLKDTIDERDTLVSEGKVYENLKVYYKDTKKEYRWTGTEWEIVDGSSGTGTGEEVDLTGLFMTSSEITAMLDDIFSVTSTAIYTTIDSDGYTLVDSDGYKIIIA